MFKIKLSATILLAITVMGLGAGFVYRARPATPGERAAVKQLHHVNSSEATSASKRAGKDGDKLQGNWRVIDAEQHGRRIPALNGRRLVLTDDRFILSEGQGEVSGIIRRAQMQGTFLLKQTNPTEIDFAENSDLLGNWHLHGAYFLDGNRLTICLDNVNDVDRPEDLVTKPNSKQLILNLERE
jgi:uncharacterized protein (TIGR03067 family)